MTERELNHIIASSLSWSFKIPDGPYLKGVNPYDGYGIFKPSDEVDGIPVYWESKNIKKPAAFNFNDLALHQINNLRACKAACKHSLSIFLICVDYGRKNKRVFVFKDPNYIYQRKINKKNILKKEFDKRRNFVLIKNQHIDFNEILEMPAEWEYEEEGTK